MLRPGLAINHALNGAQRFAQAAGIEEGSTITFLEEMLQRRPQ